MADMDTITLINTLSDDNPDGVYLSATLGPNGHLYSREELIAMCEAAIVDIQAGNGEDVNLNY